MKRKPKSGRVDLSGWDLPDWSQRQDIMWKAFEALETAQQGVRDAIEAVTDAQLVKVVGETLTIAMEDERTYLEFRLEKGNPLILQLSVCLDSADDPPVYLLDLRKSLAYALEAYDDPQHAAGLTKLAAGLHEMGREIETKIAGGLGHG